MSCGRERQVAEAAPLRRARRRRRRLSNCCFLLAGIGFGTAFYLVRARFPLLRAPEKGLPLLALVLLSVITFWLGARAEAEISILDEQLRRLEKETDSRW